MSKPLQRYEYFMPKGLGTDEHGRTDVYIQECAKGEHELIFVTGNANVALMFNTSESLLELAAWLHEIGTGMIERGR